MLPISPTLCGALFSAVARTARGEFDLDDDAHEKLDRARNNLEDLSDLIGGFNPTEPSSWTRFLGRLLDHSFETEGRYRHPRAALHAHGFTSEIDLPGFILESLGSNLDATRVFEDADDMVGVMRLPNDVSIAVHIPISGAFGASTRAYRKADKSSRAQVSEGVAQTFWQNRDSVLLDHQIDGPTIGQLDLNDFTYHGDRLAHIDEWRAFHDADLRRNVLLQGPPGCGKSTLCCHAARELSERTIMLTPDCFRELNLGTWLSLLEMLEPEMVILDDIDRADSGGRSSVEEKLRFFEEGYCDVPFVFFTSNDHTRLPAALRRPGRIDQIIRFDTPADDVCETIVSNLAEREGVDIPADQLPVLTDLLGDFSAAHVVEALRRARVLGWNAYGGDSLGREGDQTFLLHRDFDCQADWLYAHGFRRLDCDVSFVLDHIKSKCDPELAYEDDHEKLFRIELPNGAQLCFEAEGRSHFSADDVCYREEIDGSSALMDGIAEVFWRGRQVVLVDSVADKTVSTEMPAGKQDYYGNLLDCLERWKQFQDADLRRNVLLQGPPGCGKSTFCLHAARELSSRTLMLTPDFFESIRCAQWRRIVELLSPEMVIIDDVDRVSSHSLESKLRLFEEDYCDIPFVLFTTNDHTKLPRPMRRPGRIDQIIEVEPPDRSLRWQLIREMADRVGTDVPDEQIPRLESILKEHSTAHLVEALRRGKVDGWDAREIEGDSTFSHAVGELDDDVAAFLD